MDQKKVKILLEKFYNGDSTLEEEKLLKEYFSSEPVDPEFIADKDIFLFQIYEKDQVAPDISDEIWENLQKDNIKINNKLVYTYLRVAASIIIIIGSYFLIKNEWIDSKQNLQITDTYNNPELAYEQAKETLLYVSAMLNKGANHLEPVQKINAGTIELNKLSTFNKGLEELKPINTYNKANKYLKTIKP